MKNWAHCIPNGDGVPFFNEVFGNKSLQAQRVDPQDLENELRLFVLQRKTLPSSRGGWRICTRCPEIILLYGKSTMCKNHYQYIEVCNFLNSPAYVILLLVVVVSSVPRWDLARCPQKNLKKSTGLAEGPNEGGKRPKRRKRLRSDWVRKVFYNLPCFTSRFIYRMVTFCNR